MSNPYENSVAAAPIRRATPADAAVIARGLLGGLVGGITGFFAFRWLAQQGLYGMMIPGALLGLGAGLAARGRSQTLGIICAVAALMLGIVSEWLLFPFIRDKSFSFFLAHVHQLAPIKLIMLALGAVFAYWFGQGR